METWKTLLQETQQKGRKNGTYKISKSSMNIKYILIKKFNLLLQLLKPNNFIFNYHTYEKS